MSSPLLRGPAKALTLPAAAAAAAASTCLLSRPASHLLVAAAASTRTTEPLVSVATSSGLACCYHHSVAAAPSPRASSSISQRRAGSGLVALTVAASAVAVSAFLISFLVIRSMLACKREAEFLEKYFDAVREKLPETMASVRLVGREVSDLAMDLTDISQELTKVVRNSMSIVHTADAQLRKPTPFAQPGTALRNQKRVEEPLLASTVRDLRELVADIRSGFGAASRITGLFMWASSFVSKLRKKCS